MTTPQSLSGRRIGVPESRQLDLFADMLERRGATVIRCPLVSIRDAPDPTPVRAWLDDVLARSLDDMIWLTGEGVRRLRDFAARIDNHTAAAFDARLAEARTITRGPKPVRELRALGIGADMPATTPTTTGVIDALGETDLAGRRVGVQLYGTDPNTPLMEFLADKQAIALPVAPYVYAGESDDHAVATFIADIIDARLDAVAFTSSPQIRRLFTTADKNNRQDDLKHGLAECCVAAVGPLVAEALHERGVRVDLMPESSYFMKPLVRLLSDYFS